MGARVSANKHMRFIFVGALACIALVTLFTYVAHYNLTLGQERGALIINMSSRQRMLSQRIALYATRLVYEDSPRLQESYRTELRIAIDEMQAAYTLLSNETSSPLLMAIYRDVPYQLDVHLPLFLEMASRIATAPASDLTPALGDYLDLMGAMPNLLAGLETAVQIRQDEDVQVVHEDEREQIVALGIMLLALVVIGRFVFLPMEQRIRREEAGLRLEIDERKHAELALRESEERLRLVTSTIQDIVVMVDAEQNIQFVSPSTHKVLGYSLEELIAGRVRQALAPEDLEAVTTAHQHAVSQHQPLMKVNLRIPDTSGKVAQFEMVVNYLYDDHKAYQGAVLALRDMTDRHNMEQLMVESEKLRVALEKEQELNDLKTAMMVRVAHEFRTPLSIINLANDMIGRYHQVMTDKKREEQIQYIRTQVAHISDMLNSISFVIRPQAELDNRLTVSVAMAQLCQHVIANLQQDTATAREIRFETDGALLLVQQNGELMTLVLQQALSNAVKFSTGAIHVRAKHDPLAKSVIVRVRDEGIGVLPNEGARLSEPFFRGSNIGEISGLGLGLTIIERVLHPIGGAWRVESEVGKGTTLQLTIPTQRRQTGQLVYSPPLMEREDRQK